MGQYAFLQNVLSLVTGGPGSSGQAVQISVTPDPMSVSGVLSTVTRLTGYLKGVRFLDDHLAQLQPGHSLLEWLTSTTNSPILGPAAVPNLTAAMPAAPLQGGAQPPDHVNITGTGTTILNDSSLTATPHDTVASAPPAQLPNLPAPAATDPDNLLSGVPGLIGQLEQTVEQLAPSIQIAWKVIYRGPADPPTTPTDDDWNHAPAAVDASTSNPLSALSINVAVPIVFTDDSPMATASGSPATPTLFVRADLTFTPPGETLASDTISLLLAVPIQPIQLPCFAAIFTWKVYGTTSYSGNTNQDDNAVLIVLPANSPLPISSVAAPSGLLGPLGTALAALDVAKSLVTAPPPACLLPQPVNAVLAQVAATNRILNFAAGILNGVGHGDYQPVVITRCAVPPPTPAGSKQPTIDASRGAIRALHDLYFDQEMDGRDNFYDHNICLLVVGAPGTRVTFWNDEGFNVASDQAFAGDNSPGSGDPHGMLTLQTGSWGLLGMPDMTLWSFEPAGQLPADGDEPGDSTALNYRGFAPSDLPNRVHHSWMLDNIHSLAFTVTPSPNLNSISPTTGGVGTQVALHGSGLTGILAVTFGGVPATVASRDSEDLIMVTAPLGTPGPVKIEVRTVVGTASMDAAFTYS